MLVRTNNWTNRQDTDELLLNANMTAWYWKMQYLCHIITLSFHPNNCTLLILRVRIAFSCFYEVGPPRWLSPTVSRHIQPTSTWRLKSPADISISNLCWIICEGYFENQKKSKFIKTWCWWWLFQIIPFLSTVAVAVYVATTAKNACSGQKFKREI